MKMLGSLIHAYLTISLLSIVIASCPKDSHAKTSKLLMTIPPVISANSLMARLNSYESLQQCLWGEGALCEKEYDECIKEMNEMATGLEQDCYQQLSSCTAGCGNNQICIDFCVKDFNICTQAAQQLLSSKQRECNANLENCYDNVVETCFDLPASLTELYPRWYLAR